jgi:integrase
LLSIYLLFILEHMYLTSMIKELELFLESCRSEETRKQYSTYLKKWFNFVGDDLSFDINNRKAIEDKIIEYIVYLKKQGKSRAAIHNYIEPVCSLYTINDVILNRKKINKFVPEYRRVKGDRSYTHEEIAKLLEIADERMRVVILLLASTGIRIGVLPDLRLGDLENLKTSYKIRVYKNTSAEYITFCSDECKTAIDFYLDMRSRYGEQLTDESLLIREQFDVRFPATSKARQISKTAIQLKLYDLCSRCGIDKKNIAICHGFRKFYTTQLVTSKVNPEIREMSLGHKIGLAGAYYRPSEQEMFNEYKEAIDNLTIDSSQRLENRMKVLESEKSQIELLEIKHSKELQEVKEGYNMVISLIQENPKLAKIKTEVLKKRVN